MFVYLDNSATTRPFSEVTDIVSRMMQSDYGNPSSLHHMGLVAENALKKARKQVADALNVPAGCVYFNSGGTESDNTAILGAARARRKYGKKIITTKVEHPAVLESFKVLESEGFEAVYVDVDGAGIVDMEKLSDAIDDETILISCMHVNNESGAVMPIEEIARVKKNALFHVDAVQSFGKLSLPTKGVDMISVSGHKIHGPKGIGALYVSDSVNIKPFIVGGGQEQNFRSGTENMPGIAGLGLAAEMIYADLTDEMERMRKIREYLKCGILERIQDVKVNGPEDACPSVLNVSFLGTRGEVLLHMLEQENIYVSTGSACSSNHGGGSHVLKAMGLTEKEMEGAIRFSFGRFNKIEEMDYVLDKIESAVVEFRRFGSFR